MTRWSVFITAESDLLLPQVPGGGNETRSLPYIPGSVLRGALASRHVLRPGDVPDPAFLATYCSPDVIFIDAFPFTDSGAVHRLPLSARTCKRRPGFRPLGANTTDGNVSHGVWDEFEDGRVECPACSASLEPCSGWWYYADRESNELKRWEGTLRQESHTEIEDDTGHAKEGVLFTELRIPRGRKFAGEIRVLTDHPTPKEFLSLPVNASINLYVGRRGGRVSVEWATEDRDPAQDVDGLRENDIVKLVLRSPAIVEDDFGRPLRRFDAQTLAALLGRTQDDGVGLEYLGQQYSAPHWVHGWNAAHGMPKARELALAAGSCAAFSVRDQAEAATSLRTLLHRGGGFRTNEGFGQVAMNPPFFTQEAGDGQ